MASQAAPAKRQQDLQVQYSTYKNTLQQIAQKIGDVEQEAEEHKNRTGPVYFGPLMFPRPALHARDLITPLDAAFSPLIANRGGRLVLETLEPLPGDRKCFRMINGVLAERTVKDVIPALRTTAEGLKKVLDDLVKQYKTKQDELDKWKKKNNVQVVQS
ncbi:uncharacterized protein B0H64DRAFT_369640 [Chaetomium fimeti]|uniref:Prefoldin subunit 2 n=1 Tax=Chaetomium fimeti TaxID=1854472 RepID=A0AAE0LWL7_9PEZI|nr:hypothetical protein B0H64DRAFT_369640 [Chaetomium fimeti]